MQRTKTSVATLVIVAMVVVASLLLGVLGVVGYSAYRDHLHQKLHDQIAIDADQLSTALALPVWNFDREQINKVLESAMKDEDVYAVEVRLADIHNSVHARIRTADWKIAPAERLPSIDGQVSETRNVILRDSVSPEFAKDAGSASVGTVQVLGSTRFVEERLRLALIGIFGVIVAAGVVLVVSLYLLLRSMVLQPLREVEGYAQAVSSGDRGAGFPGSHFRGELKNLRSSIEKMVAQLDERFTALQRNEQELRASEARLNSILENTPNVAIQCCNREGEILFWNKASQKMFGAASSEALGKTVEQLMLTPENAAQLRSDLKRTEETGQMAGPQERSFRRKDGIPGTSLSTTFQIPVAKDQPLFICMHVDITELKRAQEERLRIERVAISQQRLAMLGQVAAGVAHEFRNPLQAATQCIGLMRRKPDEPENILRYLEMMEEALARMERISQRLLRLGSEGKAMRHPHDAVEIVKSTMNLVKMVVDKAGIQLSLDAAHVPPVLCDSGRVSEAILNLLHNAMDATPNGGTITVRIQSHSPEFVEIAVTDTGSGISPDIRDSIFDPFFTTKPAGKGTGLGLAIVRQILQENGGSAELAADYTSGARIVLKLPAVATTAHV